MRGVSRIGQIAGQAIENALGNGQQFPVGDIHLSWEDTLRLLMDDLEASTFDWTDFPDAFVDLQPGSTFQLIIENPQNSYPDGHRRILWHPVVGIAHHQVDADDWRQYIWDGVFNCLGGVAEKLWTGAGAAVNTANAVHGDIMVRRESQVNGQSEAIGSPFTLTIHSGPVIAIGSDQIRPETNHTDIAARVRELLSRPAEGTLWEGDVAP